MKIRSDRTVAGNTIVCILCVIVILSIIGGNVLISSAARYNVTAKQLKAWKEALYAAEAGGDIAFAEVRKLVFNPSSAFSGWTSPAPAPAPTPGPSWGKGPVRFGQANSLWTTVTVDKLNDGATGYNYYRIRATGTATLFGLRRTGVDGAFAADGAHFAANSPTRGVGDSLLRKIDFNYDHFKATYGDGDGNNQQLVLVTDPDGNPVPQITRRIELTAVPKMAFFDGALKVLNLFDGPGSAGVIDSYDSKNGAYVWAADNPSSPYYADSRNGDVSVATGLFTEGGPIYGNVSTNGGNVTRSGTQISGTIDNNVPFEIPPLLRPDTTGWSTGPITQIINPPATAANPNTPAHYVYSSLTSGVLTINPVLGAAETYVTIVVDGDVSLSQGAIVINNHVNAQIYFTGNMSIKADGLVNNNVDNAVPTNPSKAGHLQLYGISPTDGSTRSINIEPPGSIYASIYAPSHAITLTGNPDVFGAIVCYDFTGNGNTGFHYDKRLNVAGFTVPIDFQIASYVEDIR